MSRPAKTATANATERLQFEIEQHANLVQAHDTVHPDRGDCGGVGGCRLLMAEHDSEVDVIGSLTRLARLQAQVRVSVVVSRTEKP